MPRYVSLISWTDQGIRNFRETVSRAEDAARLAEKMGGRLERVLWTLGPHDIVTIAEFPDDETGTAFLLALGSLGNIRTTTLRAFEADEMERIVSKAG
ncbi:MAG TPA: GYD domain-containing protein [Actinomycetota bacterium]|nr:GYD domain-containing protein [Actinomycetota bacterium]